jgi:bacillithiol biosynthesis deacetylase BshB1
MKLDVLAIGAHPDDIELACGGTVALCVKQGKKVGLVDCTQGELGTRGTPELRAEEAENARLILRVEKRWNLEIPDGNIEVNQVNLLKLITIIRETQPHILLIPHSEERHPDHTHTHHLCKEAWFYSGLEKIQTMYDGKPQMPFRPENYLQYMQRYEFEPSVIIDVSETFQIRLESIKAFKSQFYQSSSKERETVLSRLDFLELIEVRARFWGNKISVKYGEPFFSPVRIGVGDLFHLKLMKG